MTLDDLPVFPTTAQRTERTLIISFLWSESQPAAGFCGTRCYRPLFDE